MLVKSLKRLRQVYEGRYRGPSAFKYRAYLQLRQIVIEKSTLIPMKESHLTGCSLFLSLRLLHGVAASRGRRRRPCLHVRRDDHELQHDRHGDLRRGKSSLALPNMITLT